MLVDKIVQVYLTRGEIRHHMSEANVCHFSTESDKLELSCQLAYYSIYPVFKSNLIFVNQYYENGKKHFTFIKTTAPSNQTEYLGCSNIYHYAEKI